jgi:hypothetical protein
VGLAGAGGRLVDDDLAVRLDAVPEVVADVPGDEGELVRRRRCAGFRSRRRSWSGRVPGAVGW